MIPAAQSRFIGEWDIDQDACDYSYGFVPEQCRIRIRAVDEMLQFAMYWFDEYGNSLQTETAAVPDGKAYASNAPQIASHMLLLAEEADSLHSYYVNIADGKALIQLAAERSLSDDDNTMTIVQTGTTPKGESYRNVGVYRRREA